MADKKIIELVFKIAEAKIRREITTQEKQLIEKYFDEVDTDDIQDKCAYAIQKAINIDIREELFLEQRTINFSLDAVQMLMLQLRKEASKKSSKESKNE